VIYVELLVSRAPTVEEIRIFEQEQRSRELEDELKATLNFQRKTIISTTKPTHVIVISNLEEEVEVGSQPVIQEQLQSIFVLRLVEEKELQQHVVQEQPQPILH
jgi:hypothetical protein